MPRPARRPEQGPAAPRGAGPASLATPGFGSGCRRRTTSAIVQDGVQQYGIAHTRPGLSGQGGANQCGPYAVTSLGRRSLDTLDGMPEGPWWRSAIQSVAGPFASPRKLAGLRGQESLEEDGVGRRCV